MTKKETIAVSFKSDFKFAELGILVLNYLKNILDISDDHYFKIEISLREAISNAIIHGNHGDLNKLVRVVFQWEKSLLQIRILDENDQPIDFRKIEEKINSGDVLSASGRGILIMRNYMDRVEFHSSEAGSEIVLEKRLS